MATHRTCVLCENAVQRLDRCCNRAGCRHKYRRCLEDPRNICSVCGRRLRNLAQPNCCIQCSTQLPGLQRQAEIAVVGRCTCCGIYTSQRNYSKDWACGDSTCESLRTARVQAEIREVRRQEQRRIKIRATQLRDDLLVERFGMVTKYAAAEDEAGSQTELAPERQYLVVVVPHLTEGLAIRDESRLEQLREHIAVQVSVAFSQPETPSDTPYRIDQLPEATRPRELPLFSAGCSSCRGKCCLQGEEHAFISTSTIRRYMANNPDATESEVLAAYIDRVPAEAIRGSCLYHTQKGCALPGEMRADMCNHYICPSLKEIRAALEEGLADKFFITAEYLGQFVSSSFVEAGRTAGIDESQNPA